MYFSKVLFLKVYFLKVLSMGWFVKNLCWAGIPEKSNCQYFVLLKVYFSEVFLKCFSKVLSTGCLLRICVGGNPEKSNCRYWILKTSFRRHNWICSRMLTKGERGGGGGGGLD